MVDLVNHITNLLAQLIQILFLHPLNCSLFSPTNSPQIGKMEIESQSLMVSYWLPQREWRLSMKSSVAPIRIQDLP